MPLTPAPPLIDVSDFTGGWYAKTEEAGVPANGLINVNNLVLDPATGSAVTREGYARRFTHTQFQGFRIYSMFPYTAKDGEKFVMLVMSNNTGAGVDKVHVVAHRFSNDTITQVSPGGKDWVSANARHWGSTIDGVFYGGGENDPMYSWEWKGSFGSSVWKDDPGTANFLDYASASRPVDYAFQNGDIVEHSYTVDGVASTDNFQFIYEDEHRKSDGIRWPDWDSDEKVYKRGDKVSRKISGIWKTFRCVKKHEPSAVNRPGDGTGTWRPYWDKIKAPAPVNADGRTAEKYWEKLPAAPKTKVAIWHGDRLFARADNKSTQTLLFSRIAKVGDKSYGIGKDKEVGEAGNPQWDPADWRTGGPQGAGYLPFETPEGDNIVGLLSLNYYLIVFKRYHTFVLAGLDPTTWRKREIGPLGIIGYRAATVHEGVAYFLSSRGFMQTDGTEIKFVPGQEKVMDWLLEAINWEGENNDISLWSHKGFVWMTLPTGKSKEPNRVLLYEPVTQSFWKFDLSIQAAAIQDDAGVDRLVFAEPTITGGTAGAETATYSWGLYGGVFADNNSGTREDRKHRQSRRTISGTVEVNLFKNPNYDSAQLLGAPFEWSETTDGKLSARTTNEAARWEKQAGLLVNLRKEDSVAGTYGGYEGLYQAFADRSTATHQMSFFVRRPHWLENRDKKPQVKFLLGATTFEPTAWERIGEGWWHVYYTYTGSASIRNHGIMVKAGEAVQVDMAMAHEGAAPRPFFNGFGGESAVAYGSESGAYPLIMQYGDVTTDEKEGETVPIRWSLRSPWFSYGAGAREEREARQIWALIRGSDVDVTVSSYINFRDKPDGQRDTTIEGEPVMYAYGQIPPISYAIQLSVEGSGAPSAVLALAVNTLLRRAGRFME